MSERALVCSCSSAPCACRFGEAWGPLVGCPASIDEELELRRKELRELKKEVMGALAASTGIKKPSDLMYRSTNSAHFSEALRPDLERGYIKKGKK